MRKEKNVKMGDRGGKGKKNWKWKWKRKRRIEMEKEGEKEGKRKWKKKMGKKMERKRKEKGKKIYNIQYICVWRRTSLGLPLSLYLSIYLPQKYRCWIQCIFKISKNNVCIHLSMHTYVHMYIYKRNKRKKKSKRNQKEIKRSKQTNSYMYLPLVTYLSAKKQRSKATWN